MRGIVLAGGRGTRLEPTTRVVNKHLLPVYDKMMIEYPINCLKAEGIEDITVVTNLQDIPDFRTTLGSSYEYVAQPEAGGIAHALVYTDRNDDEPITVLLGDNIFDEPLNISSFNSGARVYLKKVHNPREYGIAELVNGEIVGIEEKPQRPKSYHAVIGAYVYDDQLYAMLPHLTPSARGELEITSVNNEYLNRGALEYKVLNGFWQDAGTFRGLYCASEYWRNKDGKTR